MIEIKNLKTSATDVDALSFDLEDGNTYAIFMGKGCGKTTFASVIAGAVEANEGEILIDEKKMSTDNMELKCEVGFYSADVKLLGFMSVEETLDLFGSARGADAEKIAMQTEEALELVALTELSKCSVSSLSAYQRAKLGIATTLMGKTSLLVYDDIFKGLDDDETEDIAELLRMISSRKRTVLVCSSPAAASKFCTHAIFIGGGKMILSGSIESIENEINKTREMCLGIRGDSEEILKRLSDMPEIVSVSASDAIFKIEYYNDPQIKDKLFAAMAEISSPILSYEEIEVSLTDVYRSLIKDRAVEGSEAK